MILSTSQIESLEQLLDGKQIASSRLRGELWQCLHQNNALTTITHGSKKSYAIKNKERFQMILESLGYGDLNRMKEIASQKNPSRARQVQILNDSKSIKKRTFSGFLVNSYEPINAILDGKNFCLCPQEGSCVFISHYESFILPQDILVIGMENAENFYNIRRLKYLFTGHRVVFVSRYPQSQAKDLFKWLKNIPNQYLHFGDFDLYGIRIYLTEFFAVLGSKASFFIPEDIEIRISEHGNSKLYDKQYDGSRKMQVTDPRVQPLIDIINKYHKVYEQEGYIM